MAWLSSNKSTSGKALKCCKCKLSVRYYWKFHGYLLSAHRFLFCFLTWDFPLIGASHLLGSGDSYWI